MKYILRAMLPILFSLNSQAHAPVTIDCPVDTVLNQLIAMNLAQYHGQPVDTLLHHLPNGIITMKVMGWHNLRKAEVLYVSYPNNVIVEIFVHSFQFMDPNGGGNNPPDANWSLALFKKETTDYAIVFSGSRCMNGCQNQFK